MCVASTNNPSVCEKCDQAMPNKTPCDDEEVVQSEEAARHQELLKEIRGAKDEVNMMNDGSLKKRLEHINDGVEVVAIVGLFFLVVVFVGLAVGSYTESRRHDEMKSEFDSLRKEMKANLKIMQRETQHVTKDISKRMMFQADMPGENMNDFGTFLLVAGLFFAFAVLMIIICSTNSKIDDLPRDIERNANNKKEQTLFDTRNTLQTAVNVRDKRIHHLEGVIKEMQHLNNGNIESALNTKGKDWKAELMKEYGVNEHKNDRVADHQRAHGCNLSAACSSE